MSIKELYNISESDFNKLTYQEKYHLYLETIEWKELATKIKSINTKCLNCGGNYDLQVHHITYDNVDLLNIGNELYSDITVLCRNCHEAAHQKNIVFIIVNDEDEYNSLKEIISKSKTISNKDSITFHCIIKSKLKLCDIKKEFINKRKTNKKLKVFAVYKSNYMYHSKNGESGFPIKKIFFNKIDAEQYIKDYPAIPWHYLKIKEMTIY